MTRDRRDDRAHRQEGQGVRPRHRSPATTRRSTTPCPNCGGVVKENYRRYTCTGKPGQRALRLLVQQDPRRAAPSSWPRSRQFLRDKQIGPLEGFRSKAGWPFTAELKLVYDDEIEQLEARVRLRRRRKRRRRDRRAGRLLRPGAARPVPEVQRPRVRARQQLRLRAAAESAPHADLRLQERQDHPAAAGGARADDASCWPPARPTCSTASSRYKRGASSRPSWPGTRRRARWSSSSSRGAAQGAGEEGAPKAEDREPRLRQTRRRRSSCSRMASSPPRCGYVARRACKLAR